MTAAAAFAGRAFCKVDEAAAFLDGISERSLRRATAPGGELEHLVLRVGSRVLVKVPALLALAGLEPSAGGAQLPDSSGDDRSGEAGAA